MPLQSSRAERDRVRHLLVLESTGVMRRLADRREEMIQIFGHQRARAALVDPLRTTLDTIRFSELVLLTIPEQRAVHEFHEALDDLRWYLQYTVDMPGTLEQRLHHHLRALATAFQALKQLLGSVTEEQLEADLPAPPPPARRGTLAGPRKRKARRS